MSLFCHTVFGGALNKQGFQLRPLSINGSQKFLYAQIPDINDSPVGAAIY